MDKLLPLLDPNSFIKLFENNLPIFIEYGNKKYVLQISKVGGLRIGRFQEMHYNSNKINNFIKLSHLNLPMFFFFNDKRFRLLNTIRNGLILDGVKTQKKQL